MKRVLLALALVALLPFPALAEEGGPPAPEVALSDFGGKPFVLSKLRDKRAAVLVFWASW